MAVMGTRMPNAVNITADKYPIWVETFQMKTITMSPPLEKMEMRRIRPDSRERLFVTPLEQDEIYRQFMKGKFFTVLFWDWCYLSFIFFFLFLVHYMEWWLLFFNVHSTYLPLRDWFKFVAFLRVFYGGLRVWNYSHVKSSTVKTKKTLFTTRKRVSHARSRITQLIQTVSECDVFSVLNLTLPHNISYS